MPGWSIVVPFKVQHRIIPNVYKLTHNIVIPWADIVRHKPAAYIAGQRNAAADGTIGLSHDHMLQSPSPIHVVAGIKSVAIYALLHVWQRRCQVIVHRASSNTPIPAIPPRSLVRNVQTASVAKTRVS